MSVGKDPTTVSVGPGTLYLAPIGTAEFTSVTGTMDAAWTDLGYTEAGTVFTVDRTVQDVMVDEEEEPVAAVVTARGGTVAFALSQMTSKNMQVALGGGTIGSPAGGGTQFTPPDAGTEVYVMLAWQSKAGDERYLWRKCLQTGASATTRKKGTPQATLPVSFKVYKPSGAAAWTWFGTAARTGT